MARTLAELPQGARITDYVSLGVIAKTFPWAKVQAVRHRKGKTSRRQRDLPAPGVVDDVIALALYRQVSHGEMLRCLREGIAWLRGPSEPPRVSGESGISQARSRLGAGPLEQLRDELARPVAKRRRFLGCNQRRWIKKFTSSWTTVPAIKARPSNQPLKSIVQT